MYSSPISKGEKSPIIDLISFRQILIKRVQRSIFRFRILSHQVKNKKVKREVPEK